MIMSAALALSRSVPPRLGLPSPDAAFRRARQQIRSATGGCGRRKRSWPSSTSGAASPSSAAAGPSPKDLPRDKLKGMSTLSEAAAPKPGPRSGLRMPWHGLDTERHVLPVIGNASYMVLISGFLMTDMLSLRAALGTGYAGLVAYHSLRERPLRIPLFWSGVFALINAGAACYVLMSDDVMDDVAMAEEDEELYREHFSTLKRGNFRRLMDIGRRETLEDGTVLSRQGVASDRLYFVRSGLATMTRNGLASPVENGAFVNDIAFQQGEGSGAYRTVVASGEVKVIVWDHAELRALLKSRPEMDRNVKVCLTEHLIYLLMTQRDAALMSSKSGVDNGGTGADGGGVSAEDIAGMEEETRHFVQRWRYESAPEAEAEAMWVI